MAPAALFDSRLFSTSKAQTMTRPSFVKVNRFPPEDGDSLLPLQIFRVKAGVDCRRHRRRNGIEKDDESENNHRRRHLERVVIVRSGERHYL